MAVTIGPSIVNLNNGLVLHFDAGNINSYNTVTSTSTWRDISGSGYVATLTNSPIYNPANGGYFQFNGANQYASTSYTQPAYQSTSSFTWNIWILSNYTSSTNVAATIGNRYYSNGSTYYDFTKIDNNLNFEYYHTGTTSVTLTPGTVNTNTWYNIAIVKNTSSFLYYVNGVLTNSYVNPNSTGTNIQGFYIGGDPGAGEYGSANISVVSIYNRALSATEVDQNYQALRDRYRI
jgi:hypothetical protein